MENRNNRNTPEHHKALKKRLKIAGFILLFVGIVFAAIGFISFFSAFGGSSMPRYFWCAFIGLPMIAIGAGLLGFAYKQEISRYVKNESVPVINEAGREVAPAVRDIASAVKEGLSDDASQNAFVRCSCGELNEKGSKYCKCCGKSLVAFCPDCGKEIAPNSTFCNHCGSKLK